MARFVTMSLSRTLLSLSLISAAIADFSTGQLGDAAENLNNPPGAGYYASLPASGGPQGSILASADEGQGTVFEVKFSNLPSSGGPFRKYNQIYTALFANSMQSVSHPRISSTNGWQLHRYTGTSGPVHQGRDTTMRSQYASNLSSWRPIRQIRDH